MNNKALVSVIVPVYNVEPYLSQCLESIVAQSYDNLEILIVDDGSTDGGGKLCDQWALKDKRIQVFHQANGGLSAARNTGLDAMHGQFVMMVDSDDVVHPRCVEVLLQALHGRHVDVVIGDHKVIGERDGADRLPAIPANVAEHSISGVAALKNIFYQQGLTHSAWGRVYRAELFDGVRYPVGKLYEDIAIIYPLLVKSGRVVKLDCTVYGYRQRPGSILQHFSLERADILDTLEQLERQVQVNNPILLPAVRSRLLSAYFNILLLNAGTPQADTALADRCWQGIRRLRGGCLQDDEVRRKNKLGIAASYMGQRLFSALFGKNYKP